MSDIVLFLEKVALKAVIVVKKMKGIAFQKLH